MNTTAPAYRYRAFVLSVHDGDTLTVSVDLGFEVTTRAVIRLLGCNAIELADPGGAEAAAHLHSLLPAGMAVVITTVKPDKFGGRYDAGVVLPDGTDLVAALIDDGWASAWNGTGPKPVPAWPRQS